MVTREKMTPAQATTFGTYSVANAAHVKHNLACGCEPYRDVFTYRRWQAQGFQVQRGQKAIRIPVVKVIATENKDTGAEETHKLLGTGAVFCRHQVAATNGQPAVEPKPTPKIEPTPAPTPTPPSDFVTQTMNTWKEVN